VNRKLNLARAARKASWAEERAKTRLLEEWEIFREALRSEVEHGYSLPYRAQQAVALARAARETLAAEKEFAVSQVEEAKLLLRVREAKVEDVEARLNQAEEQLGVLAYAMRANNLGRDWAQGTDVYRFKPQVRYEEPRPYPDALEDESGTSSDDSGGQSFYDPDSDVAISNGGRS
jgi:hypothetical protein